MMTAPEFPPMVPERPWGLSGYSMILPGPPVQTEPLYLAGICAQCGGPHRFDTAVPSVLWNRVIRPLGVPEYLCTTCIVRAFVLAGVSFTAFLYGDGMDGVPIEVRVGGEVPETAALLSEENCTLRSALSRVMDIASGALDEATRA